MIRSIIATVMGVVVAIGAAALVETKLFGAANGTPTDASLDHYGLR